MVTLVTMWSRLSRRPNCGGFAATPASTPASKTPRRGKEWRGPPLPGDHMVITHSPWNHQAVETGCHFHIKLRFLTPGVTFMSVKESDYPPHLTPQHPSWKWSSLVVHLPCTLECFTRSLGSIGCNNIINTHYSASYALCVHHRYHKKDKKHNIR